jgi:hypothetical protein
VALLIGSLEFVGPNEKDGWPLAGTIVPIAYIAWSLWLTSGPPTLRGWDDSHRGEIVELLG